MGYSISSLIRRDKRQVFVSLDHRNALSLGENRERLGLAAFHWGIIIAPKNRKGPYCCSFDVSDGVLLHPENGINLNPDGDWNFRAKTNMNPDENSQLILRVMIGEVDNQITNERLYDLLEAIPLPQKDVLPEQNCVTWTNAAIATLQNNGLVEQFDIDAFAVEQYHFAIQRLEDLENTASILNYMSRR